MTRQEKMEVIEKVIGTLTIHADRLTNLTWDLEETRDELREAQELLASLVNHE